MDINRLYEIEEWLSKKVEAICSTNETLVNLFLMLSNIEVKNVAPPLLVMASIIPPVIAIPSALQPLRIRPGAPNNFDRDQLKGQVFLNSCELYMSLTVLDFPDNQTQIH
jgi:hypothetical protein